MRNTIILVCLVISSGMQAQELADFENFNLEAESFLNGSDGSGGFQSGDVFLHNFFDSEFLFWTGWAISNTTDATTPGFMNQYSAITGAGLESDLYAVAYVFPESIVRLENGVSPQGFYVTNSTYAYLSMLDGDAFAKKFGGLTGNDPDFFLLTVKAYQSGVLSEESVEFFLADFTFDDNSLDYIIDEWSYVDLSSLSGADSLSFTLTSSDMGEFGMNTPAYFCIDDFATSAPLTTGKGAEIDYEVFPNPSTDRVFIKSQETPELISLFDMNGRLVVQASNQNIIDISGIAKGTYILKIGFSNFISSEVIIKE